ncbi:hypothetical protein CJU90_6283 [Yarrowia sp. C11]|nr:hypothetical protein CJU90_6283 [Yarrowia sp. C11]KAG5370987.1 hypothetical protein CKK34_1123 [Yarrowia sp. E02]
MATESEGDGDMRFPSEGPEVGLELFTPDSVSDKGIYQTDIILPRFNPKTQEIHGEVKRLSEQLGITTRTSTINSGLINGTRVDLAGNKENVQKLVETVRDIVQS